MRDAQLGRVRGRRQPAGARADDGDLVDCVVSSAITPSTVRLSCRKRRAEPLRPGTSRRPDRRVQPRQRRVGARRPTCSIPRWHMKLAARCRSPLSPARRPRSRDTGRQPVVDQAAAIARRSALLNAAVREPARSVALHHLAHVAAAGSGIAAARPTAWCSCGHRCANSLRRARSAAPRDLPQHQQIRSRSGGCSPGPRPARAASSAGPPSGGGRRGSRTPRARGRARRGCASGRRARRVVSRDRERLADRPDPHAVPSRPCASASRRRPRNAAARSAVKVSSSKLMRGWPAPIIRCVTNLSRVAEVARQAQPRARDGVAGADTGRASRCSHASRRRRRAPGSSPPPARGTPRSTRRRRPETARRAAPARDCARGSRGRPSPRARLLEAEVLAHPLRALVRAAPDRPRACLSTRDQVTYSVCRMLESFHGSNRAVAQAVRAVHHAQVLVRALVGQRLRAAPQRAQEPQALVAAGKSERVHRDFTFRRRAAHGSLARWTSRPSAPSTALPSGRDRACAAPRSVNGREPMRPKTAIWPPVSSTARSRSRPLRQRERGEAVLRQAISCGRGSGLKP